MKVMLDTNVLIDLVAARSPYDSDVRKLCIAAAFGDVQLWVSTQSYADAYYVLCKNAPSDEVKRALLATLDLFLICGTQTEDLRLALESDWDDIEDYLIVHSAKRIPAKYFLTRDESLIDCSPIPLTASSDTRCSPIPLDGSSDTRRSPIPAMLPHAFLAFLKTECGFEYDAVDLP